MNYIAPINWDEGMPLLPHHFQASDRYVMNSVKELVMQYPYWWGIASFHYDMKAFQSKNPTLRIIDACLRLRDGTWINIPQNAVVKEVSLNIKSAQEINVPPAFIWIGIKKITSEQEIVRKKGDDNTELTPFVEKESEFSGENIGSRQQKVCYKIWNVSIFLEEPGPDYESILIGKITSDGRRNYFNETFIPPVLRIGASPYLYSKIKRVIDNLESKIKSLKQRIEIDRNKSDIGYQQLDDYMRFQIYLSHRTVLDHLLGMDSGAKTHPYVIFLELCRLAGALSAITPYVSMTNKKNYNHDDLTDVMIPLIKRVMDLLEQVETPDFSETQFIPEVDPHYGDDYLTCSIKSEDLDLDDTIYICIKSKFAHEDVNDLFLDTLVKIAPKQEIEKVVSAGLGGIKFIRTPVPEGLKDRQHYHYFKPESPLRNQGKFYKSLNEQFELSIYGIKANKFDDLVLFTKKVDSKKGRQ